ncbi:hypothetical protein HDU67_000279 [Dinochytrium kinnereticum]|nr:hypothetical protein HDU67_000279 [Dinochytrium kinnereticum]
MLQPPLSVTQLGPHFVTATPSSAPVNTSSQQAQQPFLFDDLAHALLPATTTSGETEPPLYLMNTPPSSLLLNSIEVMQAPPITAPSACTFDFVFAPPIPGSDNSYSLDPYCGGLEPSTEMMIMMMMGNPTPPSSHTHSPASSIITNPPLKSTTDQLHQQHGVGAERGGNFGFSPSHSQEHTGDAQMTSFLNTTSLLGLTTPPLSTTVTTAPSDPFVSLLSGSRQDPGMHFMDLFPSTTTSTLLSQNQTWVSTDVAPQNVAANYGSSASALTSGGTSLVPNVFAACAPQVGEVAATFPLMMMKNASHVGSIEITEGVYSGVTTPRHYVIPSPPTSTQYSPITTLNAGTTHHPINPAITPPASIDSAGRSKTGPSKASPTSAKKQATVPATDNPLLISQYEFHDHEDPNAEDGSDYDDSAPSSTHRNPRKLPSAASKTTGARSNQEIECRCRTCDARLATLFLFGDSAALAIPYLVEVQCGDCHGGSPLDKKGRRRRKERVGRVEMACQICNVVVGVGGVRLDTRGGGLGEEEDSEVSHSGEEDRSVSSDGAWVKPEFGVEVICGKCSSDFSEFLFLLSHFPVMPSP